MAATASRWALDRGAGRRERRPATHDARRFGGALTHHLHHITNLDYAWTTGQDLCLAGLDPDHAATLAGDLSGA